MVGTRSIVTVNAYLVEIENHLNPSDRTSICFLHANLGVECTP